MIALQHRPRTTNHSVAKRSACNLSFRAHNFFAVYSPQNYNKPNYRRDNDRLCNSDNAFDKSQTADLISGRLVTVR